MKPFDLAALRDRLARIGLRSGWLTADEIASHPHVVVLRDLSRTVHGDRRFEFLFKVARAAAATLAPSQHVIQAIFEDHRRPGYEFRFATHMAALRFRLCYDAARAGRPSPLRSWQR